MNEFILRTASIYQLSLSYFFGSNLIALSYTISE